MSDVPWACQEQLAALEQAVLDAEKALLLVAERAQILQDCSDERTLKIHRLRDHRPVRRPILWSMPSLRLRLIQVHPLILLAERMVDCGSVVRRLSSRCGR